MSDDDKSDEPPRRGRPPELIEPIPDTMEGVARAIMRGPPKRRRRSQERRREREAESDEDTGVRS